MNYKCKKCGYSTNHREYFRNHWMEMIKCKFNIHTNCHLKEGAIVVGARVNAKRGSMVGSVGLVQRWDSSINKWIVAWNNGVVKGYRNKNLAFFKKPIAWRRGNLHLLSCWCLNRRERTSRRKGCGFGWQI